jgi:hypothetical protein
VIVTIRSATRLGSTLSSAFQPSTKIRIHLARYTAGPDATTTMYTYQGAAIHTVAAAAIEDASGTSSGMRIVTLLPPHQ